jgi:tetratricopeptide (TPR) repeat protein
VSDEGLSWEEQHETGLRAWGRGDYESAESSLNGAVESVEGHGFGDSRLSTSLIAYGVNELMRGRVEEAVDVLEQTAQALSGLDQRDESLSVNLATCFNNLGLIARSELRLAEAESYYSDALSLLERWRGRGDATVTATRANLGALYLERGATFEAELILSEAVEDELSADPEKSRMPAALPQLVRVLLQEKKLLKAEALSWPLRRSLGGERMAGAPRCPGGYGAPRGASRKPGARGGR